MKSPFYKIKLSFIAIIVFLGIINSSCSNSQKADSYIYNYDRYFAKVIYNPEPLVSNSLSDEISMISKNYAIIDYRDNHLLLGNNENVQIPIASTTKILTAIIAIESEMTDEIVKVSSYAASMPKVKLGIVEGEEYYMRDLIYAMMLCSYNDVSVAIAEKIAGSTEAFSQLMNDKAAGIGALNSSFVTPNGLDADGHYSTAYDMALISSYAMKNALFKEIVSTSQYSFNEITTSKSFIISNINKYLYTENGIGIKTGFTSKAGYCFVGATNFENTVLINTVLASGWPPNKNYKWQDTESLVEFVKANYSEKDLDISKWTVNDDYEVEEYNLSYLSDGTETVTEIFHILPDSNLLNDSFEAYIIYDNVRINLTTKWL
jgi:D-alanyl-D-alanine carboxypeptidase (penicillin-binding protein 5/6)